MYINNVNCLQKLTVLKNNVIKHTVIFAVTKRER